MAIAANSMAAFRDRHDAGRRLAEKLTAHANRPDVTVLALPRGGVPVGYEVARALRAPLDVFVVRKLGVPGYDEVAMGAIATGGVRVLNDDLIERAAIPTYVIDAVAERERAELMRRERLYRGGRPPPEVRGRTVILVDDGLATGATMMAAIEALRKLDPARIVVAVPTASREACEEMRRQADEVICARTPEPFRAVGRWYEDFSQTSDAEVRELLGRVTGPQAQAQTHEAPAAARLAAPARLIEALQAAVHPLTGRASDYDPLLARIGDARLILLGEASHGTHDFYSERAEITKRLITEKQLTAIAIEADWPDAYRVNRYVHGGNDDIDAAEALADFRRFPTWMWRNTVMVEFIEWLRAHNDAVAPGGTKVGFYGLDLYSLHASMKAVLRYLERVDPEAASRARERYACFDQFDRDTEVHGFITRLNLSASCEQGVIDQLLELQRRQGEFAGDEDLFYAVQNARLVKSAEAYYRSMFLEEVSSWNLRDRHMAETLDALVAHLERNGTRAKIAVWEHNSHLGDARATEAGQRGELNVGQLVRERYGREAVLVGFTTYRGTVTAASKWGAPAERKRVRPARPDSYEALFHALQRPRFLLMWHAGDDIAGRLRSPRLERAIGVIYRPDTERQSHYFHARLPEQFDAILHFDETRAIKPLETTAEWDAGEVPETFPFAV